MTLSVAEQPRPLWTPAHPEDTGVARFRAFVNRRHGLSLENYSQLYAWSVESIADFWAAVWDFTEVRHSVKYCQVVDEDEPMGNIPKWFTGARLNLAENLLRRDDDAVAIIAATESLSESRVTWAELRQKVAALAWNLRQWGVTVGDRVAGYMPNGIETVVAMLAAASIGAIWSSTSPDFGVQVSGGVQMHYTEIRNWNGVLDRFTQIQPKVLFSVNAVWYNGKVHDHMDKLRHVVGGLSNLVHTVVVPFVHSHAFDLQSIPNGVLFAEVLGAAPLDCPSYFEQLPFDHPAYILYSSGTTGKPKCLVHGLGGSLIQHLKEHIIHGDMSSKDVFLYYTTAGWMMWNWLVAGLATGATLVLFDGSPFKPDPEHLFTLIDKYQVTVFGTSAKYLQSLEETGARPIDRFSLKSMRTLYSTGSPLSRQSFEYVYFGIKKDVMLSSITGGTDIVSLFAGHCTALPVYCGEVQCRTLGMKVEAWSSEGKPVANESGDLVCTKPFPCMPVCFWNDKDGSLYKKAYFDVFPDVWHHGDFVYINPATGGLVMLGRSDGTLNPGGVRFGSAEIYRLVEAFPEIADSLVVGQKIPGDDERVVLFIKPAADFGDAKYPALDPALVKRIRETIRGQLSPRHVPAVIMGISDIPYTLNGKKVEVAVKRIISGETLVPSNSLRNPESLELFHNVKELAL